MKTQIATTIEQSKKLLELGFDANTSDMYYSNLDSNQYKLYVGLSLSVKEKHFPYLNGYIIPAWSLSALLSLIPKLQSKEDEITEITGAKIIISPFVGVNSCFYINQYGRIEIKKEGTTSIEAAFNMVCWLIEQGYIKIEKI